MELNTAASVIRYISKLEIESGEMYEKLGRLHEEFREPFSAFARENIKNEQRVKRAYYGVVSDALETGFCFMGLQADISLPEFGKESVLIDLLKRILKLENEIKLFYAEAAHLSMSLLTDVSRECKKIANTRDRRIAQVAAMIESVEVIRSA
jgi:hypothetical protein